jgi:hypothetical protein
MTEFEIDEKLIADLDKLEPGIDDYIARRINHEPFCKVIFWLCIQHRKGNDFVTVKELSQYTKLTRNRAYEILNGLANIGLLWKKVCGTETQYIFELDENKPLIEKYFHQAKKTLKLI